MDFWRKIILDALSADVINKNFDPQKLAELIFTTLHGAVACREINEHIIQLPRIAKTLKELLGLLESQTND